MVDLCRTGATPVKLFWVASTSGAIWAKEDDTVYHHTPMQTWFSVRLFPRSILSFLMWLMLKFATIHQVRILHYFNAYPNMFLLYLEAYTQYQSSIAVSHMFYIGWGSTRCDRVNTGHSCSQTPRILQLRLLVFGWAYNSGIRATYPGDQDIIVMRLLPSWSRSWCIWNWFNHISSKQGGDSPGPPCFPHATVRGQGNNDPPRLCCRGEDDNR